MGIIIITVFQCINYILIILNVWCLKGVIRLSLPSGKGQSTATTGEGTHSKGSWSPRHRVPFSPTTEWSHTSFPGLKPPSAFMQSTCVPRSPKTVLGGISLTMSWSLDTSQLWDQPQLLKHPPPSTSTKTKRDSRSPLLLLNSADVLIHPALKQHPDPYRIAFAFS